MITSRDITVLIPASFDDLSHVWMMTHTCDRFRISPMLYGFREPHSDWFDLLLVKLRAALEKIETSHVLYTEGRDAFFLATVEEIAAKYRKMREPDILFSAHSDTNMYREHFARIPWDKSLPFPYLGVGGALCKTDSLKDALDWILSKDWSGYPHDSPPLWIEFMRQHEIALDHQAEIFLNAGSEQAAGLPLWDSLAVKSGRVHCRLTDTYPCLIHFNGGYSDPKTGKWDRMVACWRALGYTQHPPWEAA